MRKFAKFTAFMLSVFFITSLAGFLYYVSVTKDARLYDEKLSSCGVKYEFYDDNNVLQNLSYDKNSDDIKISELKEETKNAFIAIEDRRFYSHNGVDFKRILGATLKNVKSLSLKEGASTISQQLIKNTHLSSEKTLKRKLSELKITKELENRYSKNEILEKYLNTIYFGKGAYGINAASKVYFSKEAKNLTLNESATLAGLIKAPAKYSPLVSEENAFLRKNVVLKAMLDCGYITESEYNENKNFKADTVTADEKSEFLDYKNAALSEFEKLNLSPYGAKSIKIYTYYDPSVQKNVTDLFVENTSDFDRQEIIINAKNNGVIAYYGKNSNLKRCPASCVKPWLVYAPAINEGFITESTVLIDEKKNFSGYTPNNFGGRYSGAVTVKKALSESLNVPAVSLLSDFGIHKANAYAGKMNVDVSKDGLPAALGAINGGLTLKELSDCYSPFTSCGYYDSSRFIKRIETERGVIYNRKDNKRKVFSPETAYIINDVLKYAVKNGTSKKLKNFTFDLCAKTGTNGDKSGNTDAYSLSYTSEHIIGVWMGKENGERLPNSVTGGTYPTVYAREIIKSLYNSHTPRDFDVPENIIPLCVDSDFLLSEQIAKISESGEIYYYIKGTEPKFTESVDEKVSLKEASVNIKNGTVTLFISALNTTRIKIVRKYKNKTVVLYDGKTLDAFTDTLKNYGEYEYTLYLYGAADETSTTLPGVLYTKKNHSVTSSEWWKD